MDMFKLFVKLLFFMPSDLIELLKQLDIVYRKSVDLKNAGVSDFYFDIKKAYGYSRALNQISNELWGRIDKSVTSIVTAGYGGLSPATVIASRHNLYLTLIRDKLKKHGKVGWIDGYIPNGQDKVAIIDDVFTTGGSLRKIIEVIKPTGAEILGCYVVIKRGEGKLRVPLTYLLTSDDLIG